MQWAKLHTSLLNAYNSQVKSQNVILYNEYQTYAGLVSFWTKNNNLVPYMALQQM